MSLRRRKETTNVAENTARPNPRSYFFASSHCARIHPSSLQFDCRVLSRYVQSLMPIHQHLEDNWLQQFENRSPYFQQLLRRVFNDCKMHVSQSSWTDGQLSRRGGKLMKRDVTVRSAMSSPGDPGESMENIHCNQLMLNDV